jgi:hypothetical protein
MPLLGGHLNESHRTETLYNKRCVHLNYTQFTRYYQKEYKNAFSMFLCKFSKGEGVVKAGGGVR